MQGEDPSISVLVSASDAATPAEVPTASAWDTEETLDRRVMAEFRQAETDGFPDFVGPLIDRFIDEAGKHVETLRDAGLRMDAAALTATAHSLKGSSMTMGANKLATICGQMETHAKANLIMPFAPHLMAELDRELVNVRNALAAERQDCRQR